MSNRAWVTLATNDSYGLGALVLAHSLRRAGSLYPAAVLITPSVTDAMRERLRAVFAEVVTVDVLDSRDAAHLALLQRPELGITFTKIHCWNLTQYEKCVFLDADTLVMQNCDELFEREELSAAPDVGWPDCFNSGVFVFRPSQATFDDLIKFAQERGSFDGGDQGLLNSYFSDWAQGDTNKRLPFLYNVTSAAFYSYLPALKHYGQNLKIIHFIGAAKPWLQKYNWESRSVDAPEHLREFLQLWWDLFVGQVHFQLDATMSGVAGNLARVVPGASSSQRDALDELTRRQGWEAGNIDYLGADSFENIWARISQTLSQPRTSPPKQLTPSPKEISPTKEPSPPNVDSPVAQTEEADSLPPLVDSLSITEAPQTTAAVEIPPTVEVPTTVEASVTVEAPASTETPASVQSSIVLEAPPVVESSVVAEASTPIEAPVAVEEPVKVAAPPAEVAPSPEVPIEVPVTVKAAAEIPASEIPVSVTAAVSVPTEEPVAAPAVTTAEPVDIPTSVEAASTPGEALAQSTVASESPKVELSEKTASSVVSTSPASPEPILAPSSPVATVAAPVEETPIPEPLAATPEKVSPPVPADSPPLANTPSKDDPPALPDAKSEERRKGAGKLQLKPPAVVDPLPTPDSELEDAATLATSIIASELRTPTVTSPGSDAPPTSPLAAAHPHRLSVDEPEVPTPPVDAGAVSLSQIGIKPVTKTSTAAQIESSLTEKTPETAAADPPKKKIVKKVVKVVKKETAAGADAPVPPPRKKEKKPKEQ